MLDRRPLCTDRDPVKVRNNVVCNTLRYSRRAPMARTGLYKSDIANARRALLADGKHPSVDAVRIALGNTGSKTTIHRYLKEIEVEEGQGAGGKLAVSDALQDLVSRLAARLHEEADSLIAEAKARSDEQLRAAATQLEGLKKELAESRDHAARIEKTLAAEQATHKDTVTQLQQSRVLTAQLEERVAGQERQNNQREAQIRSLEEKHQHARDALEHFRAAAQDQRAREQRQHEQVVQGMQIEMRRAVFTADSSDRRGPLIPKAELVRFEPVLVSHEANKPGQVLANANRSRPVLSCRQQT